MKTLNATQTLHGHAFFATQRAAGVVYDNKRIA